VRIFALLSWYDEEPEHLKRCVKSLAGFADVLVALDGAYATFPDAKPASSFVQRWALTDAVYESGLSYKTTEPYHPWESEVQKRATLFELGRRAGATPDDWFLIIDADMSLAEFKPEARGVLEATDLSVAEVRWHDVQINDVRCSTYSFRSMFRALPGLTVERTHYLYTVPLDGGYCNRRFLWHMPDGHISDERALDLTEYVTLHHYNSSREPGRRSRALAYYRARDEAGLESKGDWH
jgi:hypothetical protein